MMDHTEDANQEQGRTWHNRWTHHAHYWFSGIKYSMKAAAVSSQDKPGETNAISSCEARSYLCERARTHIRREHGTYLWCHKARDSLAYSARGNKPRDLRQRGEMSRGYSPHVRDKLLHASCTFTWKLTDMDRHAPRRTRSLQRPTANPAMSFVIYLRCGKHYTYFHSETLNIMRQLIDVQVTSNLHGLLKLTMRFCFSTNLVNVKAIENLRVRTYASAVSYWLPAQINGGERDCVWRYFHSHFFTETNHVYFI